MKLENTKSLRNQIEKYHYFKKEGFIIEEEVYLRYYELIDKISELFSKTGMDDFTSISAFYSVLLWKGLFSVNHKFKFQRYRRYNNSYLPGFNIMTGKGACFNSAAMLKDILSCLGYEAYILVCRIEPKDEDKRVEKIDSRDEIKVKPTIGEFIDCTINEIFKKPNHAITGVIKKGKIYIADSINQDFVYLDDDRNAHYVFNKLDAKLDQRQTILVNQSMSNSALKKVFLESLSKKINKNEIEELYNKLLEYYKENKNGFDEFYEYISDDIKIIDKEYQRIKKIYM